MIILLFSGMVEKRSNPKRKGFAGLRSFLRLGLKRIKPAQPHFRPLVRNILFKEYADESEGQERSYSQFSNRKKLTISLVIS